MRMRLFLAGLLLLGCAAARADESYSFVATSTAPEMPFTITGVFTGHFDTGYTGLSEYDGLFDVTSLTNGKLNGTPITLIPAAANVTPVGSTLFPGVFNAQGAYFDDILYPNATTNTNSHYLIDNAGFLFFDGSEYLILYYTYANPTYEVAFTEGANENYVYGGDFVGATLTLTQGNATPEPGTDLLLGTGLAFVASSVRRMRRAGSVRMQRSRCAARESSRESVYGA